MFVGAIPVAPSFHRATLISGVERARPAQKKNGPHVADPVMAKQRRAASPAASPAFAPFVVVSLGRTTHTLESLHRRAPDFSAALHCYGLRRPPAAS